MGELPTDPLCDNDERIREQQLQRVLAISVFLAVVSATRPANAIDSIVLTPESERVVVGQHLEAYEDRAGELSLAQIRATPGGFVAVGADKPNFGFTSSVYWFHFAVRSERAQVEEWLLEIAYPPLDRIEIFIVDEGGAIERRLLGDSLPFDRREISHRNFVITLRLEPRQTDHIYLRVDTESSLQLPIYLSTQASFNSSDYTSQFALGMFYGLVLVMILYNLFLFATIRDRSYLLFCIYATAYVSVQAGLDGLLFQYVFPAFPAVNSVIMPISIACAALFGTWFAGSFLDLARTLPRWSRAFRYLIGAGVAIAVAAVVVPYAWSVRLSAAYAALVCLALLAVGLPALRAGFYAARFFVVAWGAFLLGSIVLVLGKFGLIPLNVASEHGPQIGFVCEVILLSFALADRVNMIKAETEAAQKRALEAQTQAKNNLEAEVARQTRELRDQAERLRDLDLQKTEFFQNVSHELRTPLTLILSPLEQLAAREELADDPRIELAMRNARRLLRLVSQLLDFQKLAAGKTELCLVPVNLTVFLDYCAEDIRPACAERDVGFDLRLPDGKVMVRAEADALEKIVFNYLSNALKYTPAGGSIELSLSVDPASALIAVADTGPGISQRGQSRLFHVFSQAGDVATDSEGTGLGLALVKKLTEAMDGSVGVDSQLGKGSRFWLELPLADADEEPLARPRQRHHSYSEMIASGATDEEEANGALGTGDGGLVLIVDDLPDMRRLVAELLTNRGHRVLTAANGRRALELAHSHAPDLVICDWMMPKMSGPELIEAFRADDKLATTPIILLTARSDEESRLLGTRVGADAFLPKPFNEQELGSVVHNLLQLKAREREVNQLNLALRTQNQLLARTQRQKDELTRFIVHDLKSPLTIILGNLELMLDEPDLAIELQVSLASALVSTEKASRMVLDILDIARSEDGALVTSPGAIAVASLFDDLTARMKQHLLTTGHELTVEANELALWADQDLTSRILENLIENAAKYSPAGKPIAVAATAEPNAILIRVVDEGEPIPADRRERIFDKYYRLERDDDHQARSSRGLGLVFCRLASDAQDGAIWVEDSAAGGNCFCVRLPRPT